MTLITSLCILFGVFAFLDGRYFTGLLLLLAGHLLM